MNRKKTTTILSILLCISAFVSCNSSNYKLPDEILKELNIDGASVLNSEISNTEIIDLNDAFGNNQLDIDDLVDTMYVVPLETNADDVFYGIQKIIVTEDRIFIKDGDDRVLIFDNDGKYISMLKEGQGPGEIYELNDFSYDEKNQLLVVSQPFRIQIYDKNGVFIESKNCPIDSWEFNASDWGYVFYTSIFVNKDLGENAKYAALITDKNLKVIGKGISFRKSKDFANESPCLYQTKGKIIISETSNDTIFELTKSKIFAKYILDYQKVKVDINNREEILNSSKLYHCGGFTENNKTQFFHFGSGKGGIYTIIRDKNTKKTLGGQYLTCSPDIVPPYSIIRYVFNDFFVSYMNPYNNMHYSSPVLSDTDKKKLEKLTEDDNAVLIFFKMKDIK